MNDTTDGLMLLDAAETLVVANDRLCAMLGLAAGSLPPGTTLAALAAALVAAGGLPGHGAAAALAALRAALAAPAPTCIGTNRAAGTLRLTAMPVPAGGHVVTVAQLAGPPSMPQDCQTLERDLRRALVEDRLSLAFQPVFDAGLGRVNGYEALLRWTDRQRGVVPPGAFVPLAEETGLIVPIGEWVLRRACRIAAGWPGVPTVAVNISAVQFHAPGLLDAVARALDAAGLPPQRLEIEVTESRALHDSSPTLHRLREMGVRIAMDDFGTGYSSLGALRSLPFDKIKIDRSFVNDLAHRGDARAIVTAIIQLARSLGMRTTAEGVETAAQLEVLRAEGCDNIQGYLLGRPVPEAELDAYMARLASQPVSAGRASGAQVPQKVR